MKEILAHRDSTDPVKVDKSGATEHAETNLKFIYKAIILNLSASPFNLGVFY